jgi:cyclopropane fatty-acyl-phospholipid synthase-like methyltransferase
MHVRNLASITLAIAALLFAAVAPSAAQDAMQQRFSDPKEWSKAFDDPERDKWQKPDEIIAALKLRPTDLVADIGAGTGYLAVRLARALTRGTVYAVDIEESMVRHLTERAKASGIANLRGVTASATATNLPEPVDVAVLLNVYHHISERPAYFKRLKSSLKPGARVAIIEYRPESPVGQPQRFRLAAGKIESEMKAAGYKRVASHDFLPYQSFQVFQAASP